MPTTDNRTRFLNLPLPDQSNSLTEDVGRITSALTTLDAKVGGLEASINVRLASAWDANGQPTAYALAGVVAVHRYDTRKDWDRGAWRRGRLARQSSWYQETLNTATRGSKREFPVVALLVVTTSLFVVYDLHDLDANGSPRMWMVQNNGNGALVLNAITNTAPTCVSARSGLIYVGTASSTATHVVGAPFIDLLRDRAGRVTSGGTLLRTTGMVNRNVGVAAETSLSPSALASNAVYSIDMRVLPGAPLDPVSRLPIPTVAVACGTSSGGLSVIHPTGLVATITNNGGFSRVRFLDDRRLLGQYGGTNSYSIGLVPFATMADSAWSRFYIDGSTTAIRHIGGVVYGMLAAEKGAIGHDNGLTLIAEDKANMANSLVDHITKSYATGWMPGDCRLAALCDGAGSSGASGGELFGNGDFSTATGWVANGSWRVDTGNKVANCGTVGGWLKKAVTLAPNSIYTFTFDAVITGGGYLACAVFDADGGSNQINAISGGVSASGSYVVSVVTGAASAMAGIYFSGGTGSAAAVRNFRLRRAGTFSDVITGTGELVANGDFSSGNTAGWSSTTAALSVVSGKLRLTANGNGVPFATYAVPTKAGEAHLFSVDFTGGTAASGYVQVGSTPGGSDLYIASQGAGTGSMRCQFTAAGSTSYITVVSTNAAAGTYCDWNKASVRLCAPDRGYKARGMIVNGTLNRAPVGAGNDLVSCSGFGANRYLSQPYNPDFDPGAGDLCIALWHRAANGSGWLVYRADAAGGALYRIGHNVSGISFFVSDGTISQALNTTTGFSDGSWHLGLFIRRASTGKLEYWLDGVLAASVDASAVGSLSKNTAIMTIGAAVDGSTPAASAELALVRVGTYAPTPAQIRRLYADESALFRVGAKAFLGGTSSSVQALALDEDTGVLAVATADGVDRFAGLRRVAHHAPAAGTAFTAASVTGVSAGGGAVLIGTSSEAGLVAELQPVKDELRQGLPAAANDIVMEGVTTDATPADIGKIFVNEGESVQIEMEVQAAEYGQTPTEGASYTVRARVRRHLGGSVQLVGSAYHVTVDETTSTMDATVTVDAAAQAFSVNVTGKAGVRLIWRARLRLNWISEVRNAA